MVDVINFSSLFLSPIVSFLFMYAILDKNKNKLFASICFAIIVWTLIGSIVLLQE